MPDIDEFNLRQDGSLPSAGVLALLTTDAVLRARAAVRLAIASQDRDCGDTLAEWRNRQVAEAMMARAESGS